jgi:hypothetical protein
VVADSVGWAPIGRDTANPALDFDNSSSSSPTAETR